LFVIIIVSMNQEEIQKRIDTLIDKRANLKYQKKYKKKRQRIDKKINALQRQLQQYDSEIYSFPADQFELTPQEYHNYFSHIETLEADDNNILPIADLMGKLPPPDRHQLFSATPLIAKCMPALLIPRQCFQKLGYKREYFFWINGENWNQFSTDQYEWELMRTVYMNHLSGITIFDARYAFETEADALRHFEDQTFIRKITETQMHKHLNVNAFGDNVIAFRVCAGIWNFYTVVVWRVKAVIIKLFAKSSIPNNRAKIRDLKKLIGIANIQAQLWNVNDDTVTQLLTFSHYQELVVGLRVQVTVGFTSRRKTYLQHRRDMEKIEHKWKCAQTNIGVSSMGDWINRINYRQMSGALHELMASGQNVYQLRHRCETCRKITTKPCKGCKKVYYCSIECQKKDWQRHKQDCTFKKKLN